jgi:hypothetical protein
MSILNKIKNNFENKNKFQNVFLCPQELEQSGVKSTQWRLVGPLANLRLAAVELGLGTEKIQAGKIPYCRISEDEMREIEKKGVEKKTAKEIFGDENMKAEILAIPEPSKKEEENFKCEKCGGVEGWLPRAPGIDESNWSNWRCVQCKPSPTESIVAKRCGPAWESSERERMARESVARQNASQSIVVALEKPTCEKCGCSWVVESPTLDGVDRRCWACQSSIDDDAYLLAATTPPAWKSRVWRRGKQSWRNNGDGPSTKVESKR